MGFKKICMLMVCCIVIIFINVGCTNNELVSKEVELSNKYNVSVEEVLDFYDKYGNWEETEISLSERNQFKNIIEEKNRNLVKQIEESPELLEVIENEICSYPDGTIIAYYNKKIKVKGSDLKKKSQEIVNKKIKMLCEKLRVLKIEVLSAKDYYSTDSNKKFIDIYLDDDFKVCEKYFFIHKLQYTKFNVSTTWAMEEIKPNLYSVYIGMP